VSWASPLIGIEIMADESLIDKEISAIGDQILESFEPSCVKGASYDIRVGSAARVPSPNADSNIQWVALGIPPFQESVSIPPGSTCMIKSLEKVHMPKDMKGHLALRAFHAKRLIFFAGGIIDPGYDDFLFLPIANLGDIPIELKYGEALVTAEFIKLGKEAAPYQRGAEAPGIVAERPFIFDRLRLSREVREQGESIQAVLNRLESSEILINASQRILDLVILAAVAGGAIAAVVVLFPSLSFPWNVVGVGVGAAFGTVAVALLIRSIFHRRQR